MSLALSLSDYSTRPGAYSHPYTMSNTKGKTPLYIGIYIQITLPGYSEILGVKFNWFTFSFDIYVSSGTLTLVQRIGGTLKVFSTYPRVCTSFSEKNLYRHLYINTDNLAGIFREYEGKMKLGYF